MTAGGARSALCVVLLAAVIAVAVPNGMFASPLFDPMFFHIGPLADSLFIPNSPMRWYFTSALIVLFTLILSAIPAALYERVRRLDNSTPGSLMIWLLMALLLSAPSWLALTSTQ